MTDAALFEVLRNRLWAINDEAVDAIVAVSGSPIATEGNDFNSGILTATGEVALAGPYVLVHAAALGQVVRYVIEEFGGQPGIAPGDMFITNDTYVGAPHQPDVMVVAPVFRGDRLIAWCGSCVHQNDVGGPVPGSITVGATSIFEEAVPMAPTRIVAGGELVADVEQEYLGRSRTPELNRLDLLGQIEANQVVAHRLNGLCDRYNTDTVVAVLEGLIDRTEAAVRARLASLPDGRWRHRGLVEHDGIDDRVYEIGLTMTKRGDSLHLDFTDASSQAPALINTSRAITSSYAMAAVMTVLGYGLPWTPAAFWRVMEIDTTPGTIVDCLWPAGMSMGVTAAGQEVRTAVNVCLSRMFDASDDLDVRNQILASCVSGSFTQTISGAFDDGQDFSAMPLDSLPGGSGAQWGGDGPDTGGYLTSPAGLCRERIGRAPAPPLEEPPDGRRLSSTVVRTDGRYLCRCCGHNHGPATEPLVNLLVLARSPIDERTYWPSARPGANRFELRRLFCPACAVQVDVQVALADAPLLETAEMIDL